MTDALSNQTLMAYDVASNVVQRTVMGHPPGQPGSPSVLLTDVAFAHDELSRVFRLDESLFLAAGFTAARPVSLLDEDSDGKVTTFFEFDALSRSTFLVEDDGEVRSTIYDGASRAIEQVDALGNRQLTTYDKNSNPLTVASVEVSPESLVPIETFTADYVWDQLNRLARATDNAGQTTRFEYDSRDNLVFRSDPEGPETPDPLGLFPGPINGPGNTETYVYDGLGRLLAQVSDLRVGGTGAAVLDTSNPANPDGQIILAYGWDGNSRLAAIVDDNANRTSFGYDALDRQVQKRNADGTEWLTVFDRDDNARSVTDPNGTIVTNTFDALNRLVRRDIDRAVDVLGTTLETYGYDGLSRLTRSTDDNGVAGLAEVERVYDSLSRLVEERQNGRALSSVFTGDGKRVSSTYPGGRQIAHTFDAIDRVKTTTDGPGAAGVIATSSWIGPGLRELRRENGNQTVLTFLDDSGQDTGYDAVKRIANLRVLAPGGGSAIVDRQYTYNRADMRTSEVTADDLGQGDELLDRFAYDSTYRVIQSDYDLGPGGTRRERAATSYSYDGVGNRVATQETLLASSLALQAAEVVDVGPASLVRGDALSLGAWAGRGRGQAAAVRLLPNATVEGRVAGPSVELQPGATVDGDVETDALVARSGSTITGAVRPFGPPEPLPSVDPIAPSSLDVTVRSRRTRTLAPGAYRRVTVRQGAELVLAGGTYELESLDVGQAATVSIRGPVWVRVRSGLSFAPRARVEPAFGLQTADVRWETLAPKVSIQHDVALFGVLVAPESAVRVSQGARVTGTVHAARVDLVQTVAVTSPVAAGEDGRIEMVSYAVNEMNEYTEVNGVTRSHDDNGNLLSESRFTYSYDYRNRLVFVADRSLRQSGGQLPVRLLSIAARARMSSRLGALGPRPSSSTTVGRCARSRPPAALPRSPTSTAASTSTNRSSSKGPPRILSGRASSSRTRMRGRTWSRLRMRLGMWWSGGSTMTSGRRMTPRSSRCWCRRSEIRTGSRAGG